MSTMTIDRADLAHRPGGSLKATSPGRLGGLLVSFNTPDRSKWRDYFDARTDYGKFIKGSIDVLWHHGLDEAVGDDAIGEATVRPAAKGLEIDAQIDDHSPGGKDLMAAAKSGKLAWSSGAVSHRVRRIKQPDGTSYLARWHVAEASATLNPADPNAKAWLKALDLPASPSLKALADAARADALGDRLASTLASARALLARLDAAPVPTAQGEAVKALGEPLVPHRALPAFGWALLADGLPDDHGDHFTEATKMGDLDDGPVLVPLLAEHDARKAIGVARLSRHESGVWAEILATAHDEAARGFLSTWSGFGEPAGLSTGAGSCAKSGGRVLRWDVCELSLVRRPAEPALKCLKPTIDPKPITTWRAAPRGWDGADPNPALRAEATERFREYGLAAFGVRVG